MPVRMQLIIISNKMVLPSSQDVANREFSPFSLASIFVIFNGACLIFAVAGNVLEKCCFFKKKMEFYF